mmetsp:Transcript_35642/g.109363  ORF Transcript_35642/g.109363 Transcript_35642/m.109363 type:complete len:1199 (-) Transcript_35642:993-4589(-)
MQAPRRGRALARQDAVESEPRPRGVGRALARRQRRPQARRLRGAQAQGARAHLLRDCHGRPEHHPKGRRRHDVRVALLRAEAGRRGARAGGLLRAARRALFSGDGGPGPRPARRGGQGARGGPLPLRRRGHARAHARHRPVCPPRGRATRHEDRDRAPPPRGRRRAVARGPVPPRDGRAHPRRRRRLGRRGPRARVARRRPRVVGAVGGRRPRRGRGPVTRCGDALVRQGRAPRRKDKPPHPNLQAPRGHALGDRRLRARARAGAHDRRRPEHPRLVRSDGRGHGHAEAFWTSRAARAAVRIGRPAAGRRGPRGRDRNGARVRAVLRARDARRRAAEGRLGRGRPALGPRDARLVGLRPVRGRARREAQGRGHARRHGRQLRGDRRRASAGAAVAGRPRGQIRAGREGLARARRRVGRGRRGGRGPRRRLDRGPRRRAPVHGLLAPQRLRTEPDGPLRDVPARPRRRAAPGRARRAKPRRASSSTAERGPPDVSAPAQVFADGPAVRERRGPRVGLDAGADARVRDAQQVPEPVARGRVSRDGRARGPGAPGLGPDASGGALPLPLRGAALHVVGMAALHGETPGLGHPPGRSGPGLSRRGVHDPRGPLAREGRRRRGLPAGGGRPGLPHRERGPGLRPGRLRRRGVRESRAPVRPADPAPGGLALRRALPPEGRSPGGEGRRARRRRRRRRRRRDGHPPRLKARARQRGGPAGADGARLRVDRRLRGSARRAEAGRRDLPESRHHHGPGRRAGADGGRRARRFEIVQLPRLEDPALPAPAPRGRRRRRRRLRVPPARRPGGRLFRSGAALRPRGRETARARCRRRAFIRGRRRGPQAQGRRRRDAPGRRDDLDGPHRRRRRGRRRRDGPVSPLEAVPRAAPPFGQARARRTSHAPRDRGHRGPSGSRRDRRVRHGAVRVQREPLRARDRRGQSARRAARAAQEPAAQHATGGGHQGPGPPRVELRHAVAPTPAPHDRDAQRRRRALRGRLRAAPRVRVPVPGPERGLRGVGRGRAVGPHRRALARHRENVGPQREERLRRRARGPGAASQGLHGRRARRPRALRVGRPHDPSRAQGPAARRDARRRFGAELALRRVGARADAPRRLRVRRERADAARLVGGEADDGPRAAPAQFARNDVTVRRHEARQAHARRLSVALRRPVVPGRRGVVLLVRALRGLRGQGRIHQTQAQRAASIG